MRNLKYYLIFLSLFVLLLYLTSNKEELCTDDGCPEFYDDRNGSHTVEFDDIEQWIENPAIISSTFFARIDL